MGAFFSSLLNALVEDLKSESGLFAHEWHAHSVMAREGGARTFMHPVDGSLIYAQHTFSPAERLDYKLVALFPLAEGRFDGGPLKKRPFPFLHIRSFTIRSCLAYVKLTFV